MRNLVVILLVLGIVGIGTYFVFGKQTKKDIDNNTYLPSTSQTPLITPNPLISELLRGGSSFTDPKGLYSFLYPYDFTLDTQDPLHPRVFRQGETQRGQTEMYDGILVVFESVKLSGNSLEQVTDNHISESLSAGISEVIQPKKEIVLNNYKGFSYTLRGLGESNYIVIQKNSQSQETLRISYLVADPQQKGYQADADAILSTIELRK